MAISPDSGILGLFFLFFSKTVVLFCRGSGGIKVADILDELGSQEMWLGV